jgi:hypothetical protein
MTLICPPGSFAPRHHNGLNLARYHHGYSESTDCEGGFLAQAQEVFQLSRVDGMKTLCFQVTFTKSVIFWQDMLQLWRITRVHWSQRLKNRFTI